MLEILSRFSTEHPFLFFILVCAVLLSIVEVVTICVTRMNIQKHGYPNNSNSNGNDDYDYGYEDD